MRTKREREPDPVGQFLKEVIEASIATRRLEALTPIISTRTAPPSVDRDKRKNCDDRHMQSRGASSWIAETLA